MSKKQEYTAQDLMEELEVAETQAAVRLVEYKAAALASILKLEK